MNKCKDCKHFTPSNESYWKPFGSCERWKYGYRWEPGDMQPNDVLVENDEGWGAYVGPEFGCVLFERHD